MTVPSPTLRELFEAALALTEPARGAFLDTRCPADLRRHVERLLEADEEASEPLSKASLDRLARLIGDDDASPPLPPGTRVGPFELVRVIGEGGSSTVFHATRTLEGATQDVALKLLRHSLHSPESRRRFGREQRALIQLRHPNIARLIEGGVTESGLPYIALELVDGTSITDHASARGLPLRERLALFVVACAAVDAAHRSLIVHRDLKPSNVLVTGEGEVKLLDFGIAKLLAEDDDGRTLLPGFTPAYAAPEQRSGGAITTATDVHALGVLLGELVTGQRVNDGSGRTPSGRIAAASGNSAVSAQIPVTRREVSGDLDAIVMKAVDADPAARYASAGAFADDVQRLLEGRPVLAQAPTLGYRTRKFVLRHKGAVLSTLALVIAVLAALGIAVWQAQVAHREALRATAQARHAEAIRDFLVSVFDSARSELPREKRPTVEELVDAASERALRDESVVAETRTDLLLTLAEVSITLGAYDRATALLDRALPGPLPQVPHAGEIPMRARMLRARVLLAQARPADAAVLLEPLRTSLSARGDANDVEALIVLGNALSGANRPADAEAVFSQASALSTAVPTRGDELALRVDVARTESLVFSQQFAPALALAEPTWRRWKALGRAPDRDVLNLLAATSTAAEAVGDAQRADTAYRDAIDVAERLYVRPHPDTAWVIGVYGSYLIASARYADAEPYVERALSMRRDLLGDAHPDTLNAIAALGRLRSGQQRLGEARAAFADGVALCARDHLQHPVCPRLLGSLAQVLMNLGELDAAAASAAEAVAMQRQLTGPDGPQLIGVLGFLARVQVRQQRDAEALRTTDELLHLAERAGSSDSKDARYARFQRALALFSLGRNDEALALASAVVTSQKEKTPDETSTLFSMLVLQARALSRADRIDEAKAVAREALAIERKPRALDPGVVAGLERLARNGRGY